MKILFYILLLTACSIAQAEMYKSLDENGEVVYSDKPPTLDAKEIKLPPITVQTPVKTSPKPKSVTKPKLPPYVYSDMQFSSPENDENIYGNDGAIAYALIVTPTLNTVLKHYLTIKLDGKVVIEKTSSLNGSLNDVDRGSHHLSADIHDANGTILRSASMSFHVHKASLLKNNPVIPPPAPRP